MTLFFNILSVTLVTTPIILIILGLTPFMGRVFAPNGRHFLWLVLSAVLLTPFLVFLPAPAVEISVPMEQVQLQIVHLTQPVGNAEVPLTLGLADILFFIWLGGMVGTATIYVARYVGMWRFMRHYSKPESNLDVLAALESEKSKLGLRKKVKILRCKGIASPMFTGLLRPSIILPANTSYSPLELSFVLRHELTHHKRRDIWTKLLLQTIKSIYWFNPAVYLMAKQSDQDMEMICDAQTTGKMSVEEKKQYSQLILSLAKGAASKIHPLATSMASSNTKMLKRRFCNILSGAKKRGRLLFSVIAIGSASGVALVGFTFAVPIFEQAQTRTPRNIAHFIAPSGYTWQNLHSILDEHIVQITVHDDNIIQREFALAEPVHSINIDFVSQVYVVSADRDFVSIVSEATLFDMMDIFVVDGVLTITPTDTNIIASRHFRDFTRIYVGVSTQPTDVGVGLLNARNAASTPYEDMRILTHRLNPVNVQIDACVAKLYVNGVSDVSFSGEGEQLILNSATRFGMVDMGDLPVSRADLNLTNGNNAVIVNASDYLNIISYSPATIETSINTVGYIGNPVISEQIIFGRLDIMRMGGIKE
ncbi:MAG: DUF2807 domain-containing protein [Defluviitaleaceae bacterium]|nr:DUF2807 domain-containing protein [Defluviitaleaceae bacterium]